MKGERGCLCLFYTGGIGSRAEPSRAGPRLARGGGAGSIADPWALLGFARWWFVHTQCVVACSTSIQVESMESGKHMG